AGFRSNSRRHLVRGGAARSFFTREDSGTDQRTRFPMKATRVLTGRREGELLAFPSVRRMANILSVRCREPSWVRTSVASLERFRIMTGHTDLEMLLTQAKADQAVAEQALASFASALSSYTEDQVSALA